MNSHSEPLHASHSKVVSLTYTTVVVALVMWDPGKQYANELIRTKSIQSPYLGGYIGKDATKLLD